MAKFTQIDAVREIQEQLSSDKRKLGFFMGAGTSMAVNLPGIDELTSKVYSNLDPTNKTIFDSIKKSVPDTPNIEKILDKVRLCCELFEDDEHGEYYGIKGGTIAKNLDAQICRTIRDIIQKTDKKDAIPHKIFSQWLKALHSSRISPVEIFTLNYDLIIEEAMEEMGVPFFDGFIGSSRPFFAPESVEIELGEANNLFYPPIGWTRLWKLHGSINWYSIQKGSETIISRNSFQNDGEREELMIFPSREKYSQSRKLPFLTYQDRLRKFLAKGETLLIICGYSFSDQHINEILFQGLRSNPRLSVIALVYGDKVGEENRRSTSEITIEYGKKFRNLTILGPDKVCVGGIVEKWEPISSEGKEDEISKYWDGYNFTLGDFTSFTSFIEYFFRRSSFLVKTDIAPLKEELKKLADKI